MKVVSAKRVMSVFFRHPPLFDIAATMDDVVSLGIGEPDFVTPSPILQAGIASLPAGNTAYTSNAGTITHRRRRNAHPPL
ncbi:MAG: hypothetical protein R2867_31135 [Caldilineaceae bacterium]